MWLDGPACVRLCVHVCVCLHAVMVIRLGPKQELVFSIKKRTFSYPIDTHSVSESNTSQLVLRGSGVGGAFSVGSLVSAQRRCLYPDPF